MSPIAQAPKNIEASYIPANLEIADEMAKLETLRALRSAILEHRQLLERSAAGVVSRRTPEPKAAQL